MVQIRLSRFDGLGRQLSISKWNGPVIIMCSLWFAISCTSNGDMLAAPSKADSSKFVVTRAGPIRQTSNIAFVRIGDVRRDGCNVFIDLLFDGRGSNLDKVVAAAASRVWDIPPQELIDLIAPDGHVVGIDSSLTEAHCGNAHSDGIMKPIGTPSVVDSDNNGIRVVCTMAVHTRAQLPPGAYVARLKAKFATVAIPSELESTFGPFEIETAWHEFVLH